MQGLKQLDDGRVQAAIEAFEAAARHADKPSQALLGELYWKGELVAQDRALAYVWMDLAAERLYRPFLALREHYWAQLSPTERSRVEDIGPGYYQRFGDEVAKPRLETRLRRERRSIVGSRTGFRGYATVYVPGPGGQCMNFSGEQFYSDTFWKPENYWRWVDETWTDPPRGKVDVGPLEPRSEVSN